MLVMFAGGIGMSMSAILLRARLKITWVEIQAVNIHLTIFVQGIFTSNKTRNKQFFIFNFQYEFSKHTKFTEYVRLIFL